jgi:hypothetical protein
METARPKEIVLGAVRVQVPVFFPSVSTIKTALRPLEYLTLLHSLKELNGQFLVSAFDLHRSANSDELSQLRLTAREPRITVLMDSGNYESYWKEEQESWCQSHFHEALRRFPCSFAFGFDEQNPPEDKSDHINLIIDRWEQDQAVAGNRVIVPIVHGNTEILPAICSEVARATQVPMVAIAERRLGDGVFERAKSVTTLRKALDDTNRYVGLHLLGGLSR